MSSTSPLSFQTLPNRQSVAAEVLRIVSETSGVSNEELHEGTLIANLPWDSLDDVECIMELEEQFDISISDDLTEGMKSISDIIDEVMELLSQSTKPE